MDDNQSTPVDTNISLDDINVNLDDINVSLDDTVDLRKVAVGIVSLNTPHLKSDIASLNELERHLFALNYALSGLSAYGPTIDPEAATEDRGEALAILQEESRALLCSPETGALLNRLSAAQVLLTPMQAAQVRILQRDRSSMVDVPPEVQAAYTRLITKADHVWRQSKARGDWLSFEPYLDRIVARMREIAQYRQPNAQPYDVWLNEYEPGTGQDFYDRFFAQVKEVVVPLLADVSVSNRAPSGNPFVGRFDPHRQWDLARDVMRLQGLDERKVFLTSTEHPFSQGLTSNHAIIAAHVKERDVLANVFTMLHEGGHALYELGVNPQLNYTSLKGGTSMGMHEAQSRFFENYVGRSLAFAPRLVEIMARRFRGQLRSATTNQLYTTVNQVQAQPIRTNADELTYPLHVLVRYEVEQLLVAGEARASDVPRLWHERYLSYLGINVRNDARGALQDSHWSGGLIGYFPTYAYGSAIGAQLKATMERDGMDFDGVCASGDLMPIHEWLKHNIWYHGRTYDTADLIMGACGEPFSPTYYTDYLTAKFSALYGL